MLEFKETIKLVLDAIKHQDLDQRDFLLQDVYDLAELNIAPHHIVRLLNKKDEPTFQHHNQPYGTIKFKIEVIEILDKDHISLFGEVVEGGVTNRILHHTNFVSKKGEIYDLVVNTRELEYGYKTTVAM